MFFQTRAALVALILALPGAALAHPKLLAATPAANATVTPTSTIKLSFSEGLVPKLSGATVTMTSMPGMANHQMKLTGVTSTVSPDGKSLLIATARPLTPGSYRADWAVVSVDTHRVSGTLSFSVK